ncbi:MAG: hypothetical protein ABL908_13325 [Hyphomicrobium sp.]
MTGKKSKAHDALNRLADALVDDILSASDEDMLAEFRAAGGDPDRHAAEMRALFERSVVAANKSKMLAAKSGAARARSATASSAAPIDIAKARQLLRGVLDRPAASASLTMAARKESELSDADILGLLDDLRALGVLPSGDDNNGTT